MEEEVKTQKNRQLRLNQRLRLKSSSKPESFISINPKNWKLLSSSGAHWIFATENFQEKTLNDKSFAETVPDLESGRYVMRMKKNKEFQKLVKSLIPHIAHQLQINVSQNLSQQKKLKNQSLKSLQKQNLQQNLNQLIQLIYHEFLQSVIESQNLLPLISQTIVRSSAQYLVENQNSQSETEGQSKISLFSEFIMRQLLIYHLTDSKQLFQGANSEAQNISIQSMIDIFLAKHPSTFDQSVFKMYQLDKIPISFEQNQLCYTPNHTFSKTEDTSKIPESETLSHLFEVYEFKPKTILPDIYTQPFISHYSNSYQCLNLQAQIKSMIDSSFVVKSQHHKGRISIESTRWFKKGCLSNKANNQNPLSFFAKCLKDPQAYTPQKTAGSFHNKKHLKTSILINPQQKKHQKHQSSSELQTLIIDHINKTIKQPMIKNHKLCQNDHSQFEGQNYIQQDQSSLSLMEELLSLQLIDLNGQAYLDILQIEAFTNALIKNSQIPQSSTESLRKIHNQTIEQQPDLTQILYPSNILPTLSHLFRSQVYRKSRALSQLLSNIVLNNPSIQSAVTKFFGISFHSQQTKAIAIQTLKQQIYCIVRFLISLTWKDISIMVQTLTTLNLTHSDKESKPDLTPNHTEIINCAIIDYGIKTTQNIFKNKSKQLQFLHNYHRFSQSRISQINEQIPSNLKNPPQ